MNDIGNIQKKLRGLFEKYAEIGIVYLFGSQAKGSATDRSDYDFGIYFTEKDVIKRHDLLFKLSSEISGILATDNIDVRSLNDVESQSLKYNIIADGIILFEREPYKILVEPKILNEYFDFLYLLRKYKLTHA